MSIAQELEQLDELHRRGVLTDAEFQRAKAQALGGQPAGALPAGIAAVNALRPAGMTAGWAAFAAVWR